MEGKIFGNLGYRIHSYFSSLSPFYFYNQNNNFISIIFTIILPDKGIS